tara:strand:+ start:1108 stop:1359 length:252 start_codon:yes stop_codon:yes gene_type:complete
MIKFLVQIRAYGYYAKFTISCVDNEKAFEDALVDKLGKNDIVWEKDGFSDHRKLWITYEEVINDPRPIQTKEVLGVKLGAGAP